VQFDSIHFSQFMALMKTISPFAWLLALAAATPWLPAHAGRPFATEDAGALSSAACELEPVLEQEKARGEPRVRTVTLQGACGVGAGTQLGLSAQTTRFGDTRWRGLGLSGKTRLMDGGDDKASWTLAYGGDWQRDPAGGTSNKGYTLAGLQALVVASVPAGAWGTLHANLGWQQQRPEKLTSTVWAAALEKSVTGTLDMGLETFGDDRGSTWVGTGLRWTPMNSFSLNASAAQLTGKERVRAYSLGAKIDF
jgi:hypothetical protein